MKVIIFEHEKYRGKSQELDIKNYSQFDLQLGDNVISSVKVPQGLIVTLYEHNNFEGKTVRLTADTPVLSAMDFNDIVSSIRIEATPEYHRLAAQKAEADRLAAQKAEADRLAAQKAEADRLAAQKAEADRLAAQKAEADRLAAQKAEADRLAAQKAGNPVATFYRDENFQGESKEAGVGRYTYNDILGWRSISSIKIPAGLVITLYEHEEFKWDTMELMADAPQLGKFNDNVKAVVIETKADFDARKAAQAEADKTLVTFYQADNFEGKSKQVGVGKHTWKTLDLGWLAISSVKVPDGLVATIYTHEDFKGDELEVTADAASLGAFNDKLQAVLIETKADFDARKAAQAEADKTLVTFYQADNFEGKSKQVGVGKHTWKTLDLGWLAISSVKVPDGLVATIYTHEDFKGDELEVTADAPSLGAFNDKLQAVLIETKADFDARKAAQAEADKTLVTFYQADNFEGKSKQVGVGKHTWKTLDLGWLAISSVKVPDGLVATIYTHEDFKGDELELTADAASLGAFNDKLQAVLIETKADFDARKAAQAEADKTLVTFYQADNFEGKSKQVGVGKHTWKTLDLGWLAISSVKVPDGLVATIYTHEDFKGDELELTADAASLGAFNDKLQAVLIETKATFDARKAAQAEADKTLVTFYQADNFGGKTKKVGVGKYTYVELDLGMRDISSVKVPSGMAVTLYDHPEYKGNTLELTADAPNLPSFNDKTQSVLIETRAEYDSRKAKEAEADKTLVTFYRDGNFQGESKQVGVGKYTYADVLGWRSISSVKVPDGFVVTLYEHEEFKWDTVELTADAPQLGKFDDNVKAILVETKADFDARKAAQAALDKTQATFYRDSNFQGESKQVGVGKYTFEDILGWRSISSVKVPDGFVVTLYEHEEFKWDTVELTADAPQLGKFDDNVKAVLIETKAEFDKRKTDIARTQVFFYEHNNFTGKNKGLTVGEYGHEKIDIGWNSISSVKIPSGLVVTLFPDGNKRYGTHKTLTASTASLGEYDNKFNYVVIESKAKYDQRTANEKRIVRVFESENYGGKSHALRVGRYDVRKLSVGDNMISSLQIPKGLMITLYDNNNFLGKKRSYIADTPSLPNWNDKASAIVVEYYIGGPINQGVDQTNTSTSHSKPLSPEPPLIAASERRYLLTSADELWQEKTQFPKIYNPDRVVDGPKGTLNQLVKDGALPNYQLQTTLTNAVQNNELIFTRALLGEFSFLFEALPRFLDMFIKVTNPSIEFCENKPDLINAPSTAIQNMDSITKIESAEHYKLKIKGDVKLLSILDVKLNSAEFFINQGLPHAAVTFEFPGVLGLGTIMPDVPLINKIGLSDTKIIACTNDSLFDESLDYTPIIGLNFLANFKIGNSEDKILRLIGKIFQVEQVKFHGAIDFSAFFDQYYNVEVLKRGNNASADETTDTDSTNTSDTSNTNDTNVSNTNNNNIGAANNTSPISSKAASFLPGLMFEMVIERNLTIIDTNFFKFEFSNSTALIELSGVPLEPSISVSSELLVTLMDTTLRFTGGLKAEMESLTGYFSMVAVDDNPAEENAEWKNPMGIPNLSIKEVAAQVGFNPQSVIDNVGFHGKLQIGNIDGSAAILLDITDPDQFVIAGTVDQISLIELASAVTPASFSFYNTSVPNNVKDALNRIVNVKLEDVQVHLVPVECSIAHIDYEEGLTIMGRLNVWGWNASAFIKADKEKGLDLRAALDTINLLNVFKVTGAKGETHPSLMLKLTPFETPAAKISAKVELLGISREVYAEANSKGLEFELRDSFLNLVKTDLKCSYKDFNLRASGKIDFNLTLNGISSIFGPIGNIGVKFGAETSISVGKSGFDLSLGGHFYAFGKRIDFPKLRLDKAPRNLEDLYRIVRDKIAKLIVNNLLNIFGNIIELAKAIRDGLISIGRKIGDIASNVYRVGADMALKAGRMIGKTLGTVARELKYFYRMATKQVARLFSRAGYYVNQIASAIAIGFNASYRAVAVALKGVGYTVRAVGGALKAIGARGSYMIAAALKGAGFVVDATLDMLKNGLGMGARAVTDTLLDVGYKAEEVAGSVVDAFGDAGKAVLGAMEDVFGGIGDLAGDIFGGISSIF